MSVPVAIAIGLALGVVLTLLAGIGVGALWFLLSDDNKQRRSDKSRKRAQFRQSRQHHPAQVQRVGRHLRVVPDPGQLGKVFDGPPATVHHLDENTVAELTDIDEKPDPAPQALVMDLNSQRAKRRAGALSDERLREIARSNQEAIQAYDPTA